jgi:hypothetical protein
MACNTPGGRRGQGERDLKGKHARTFWKSWKGSKSFAIGKTEEGRIGFCHGRGVCEKW